jgi:hypothetical protein
VSVILKDYFSIRPRHGNAKEMLKNASDLIRVLYVMLVAVGCGSRSAGPERDAEICVLERATDELLQALINVVGGGSLKLMEAYEVFQFL